MAPADDFRNPADAILRTQLEVLTEQLRGPMEETVVREALDELMRLQAVRTADASEGVRPVLQLRAPRGSGEIGDGRVERLHALALECFAHHRARIADIRAGEERRAGFVARRAREKAERAKAIESPDSPQTSRFPAGEFAS